MANVFEAFTETEMLAEITKFVEMKIKFSIDAHQDDDTDQQDLDDIEPDITDLVDESEERLGQDQSYMLNSDKIREELGWKDSITLEAGIMSTIEWVDRNLNVLKNLPNKYIHKS